MSEQSGSIGRAIKTRRAALRLSQRDLARTAQTTPAAVSHIERGIRKPSACLLARIAGVLQCTTDALLAGTVDAQDGAGYLQQVIAAMKTLPPQSQKDVVDFCDYLKHRKRDQLR